MYKILILNGPNINLLGLRQPEIYGRENYEDLILYLKKVALELNIQIEISQSNHEGVLIDTLQKSYPHFDGVVINPAAYTHTSIGLLDTLLAIPIPAIEVHLSDIKNREAFRQFSFTAQGCVEQVGGLGFGSYRKGLERLIYYLDSQKSKASGEK